MPRTHLGFFVFCVGWPVFAAGAEVDFGRDIRPILSDRCFTCHGPNDADREGGFRLDQRDSAFGEADSGASPIVAGDAASSELLLRVRADDESMVMPPPETNKQLTPEEIDLLQRWIEQGASWSEHWAFVAPTRPELPRVSRPDWCANPIDRFILARLDAEDLEPSGEADKEILIRRVTFDLTGLPPTLEEVDAFLADTSPLAYERVVDRLLKSPHYGEHRARYWLDAARYGDTHGLHLDNYREMWPYRDWVIGAFNANMPFDQFTIEQLAGDLLPDPTRDQLIATGFNRCHVTTNEGGSIKEEVYVRNVIDRVVTTAAVYMGATFDCTRCHDHKYDPFTMNDFYSMFAFFNSIDGSPMDGNKKEHPPVIKVPSQEQESRLQELSDRRDTFQQQIAETLAKVAYDAAADEGQSEEPRWRDFVWIDDQIPQGATTTAEGSQNGAWSFVSAPQPVLSGEVASTRTAEGLSQHFFEGATQGLRVGQQDKLFAFVYLDPDNPPQEIMLQWNTGSWKHRAYWGENLIDWGQDKSGERHSIGALPETGKWLRLEVAAEDVGLKAGDVITGWAFTQHGGTVNWDRAGIFTATPQSDKPFETLPQWARAQHAADGAGLPGPIAKILERAPQERSRAQWRDLRNYFLEHAYAGSRQAFAPLHQQLQETQRELDALEKQLPTTLVFRERSEPQPAFILHRGEYDQRRDQVARNVPTILPPLSADAPRNRLGFARWLVEPGHPLTSRVTVNRFWQQFFGAGIVTTGGDFGSQGAPPNHPELLDWLAVQFREDGWDVKRLVKQLVMTSTYRQSTKVTPELLERDPANVLLARGPRFRLDAETLRDQALSIGGLLVTTLGGPSVKPPQPDGLWFAVGYSGSNTVRFTADEGSQKTHRRTLYTFIKRTSPPPQMSTLDAPSRESFCVRREQTNTPLQALLLMNDPQYFEAARGLAARVLREAGRSPAERAAYAYRLCTARCPDPEVVSELVGAYRDHLTVYQADADAARQTVIVETASADESLPSCEWAAWTMVANLLLNLDEVVTKN